MKFIFSLAAIAAVVAATPSYADTEKLSGPRVELRLGYETPTVSNGSVYKLGNSASVGGELGYDLPVSHAVTVGPFVNYDYASANDCASDSYGNSICLGSDGNLAGGGRVGFRLGSRVQVYAKAGYDSFRLKASINGVSGSKSLNGVMGALGIDFNVTRAIYLGAELNYADLGSFSGVNFQRRHVALTAGARF